MITVTEFRKLLDSLYDRNYCLVRLRDLAAEGNMLPNGKIPLVMSFDDVNYYSYMDGYGFAGKMVIDSDGELANVFLEKDGRYSVGRTYDGPAILEGFIHKHPDFSFNGARGILAVTGKEGILGYHDPVAEEKELAETVTELKTKGWEFACHSFGHNRDVFRGERVLTGEAVADTDRWLAEIAPLVGGTDIYISPFGFNVRQEPALFEYLKRCGFRYFCGVKNERELEVTAGYCISDRVNIDGFLFANRNYELECYYARLNDVISEERLNKYERFGNRAWDLGMHGIVCSKMPTVYLWGGLGEIITEELIQGRKKMYPKRYTEEYCDHLRSYIGKQVRGFDCSGLIKNYLMGGIPDFRYDRSKDLCSYDLLDTAIRKGSMDTLPEERGVCLFMPGHVGIYLGRGEVAEATRNPKFGDGVVRTHLEDREWTQWFFCPEIQYETKEQAGKEE